MAGLDHEPAAPAEQEHEATIARNACVGLRLFVIYLALYLGFMLLSAFWPDQLDEIVLAGLNLAIVYGFGLIVAALVLALIYSWICRLPPRDASLGEERQ